MAEATGKIVLERTLIESIGDRCLGFMHGGGVRGNPNSGSRVREDLQAAYRSPWDVGYYNVETSGRDAHFWYRLAQHYENRHYLWAAEQVALGGRGDNPNVPRGYKEAYNRRFAWFVARGIHPRRPASRSRVGLLSSTKHRIPERLYLRSRDAADSPFAAFFLYDKKDNHLDNVAGHLYEYSAHGSKFLHSSGKYNNTYAGMNNKGGGTGEESLDLLLVLHNRHAFPLHPDRQGNSRDFMRRGALKHRPDFVAISSNDAGDVFSRFAYDDYYGRGSRWIRRAVLTVEGYLVVADEYIGGQVLRDEYLAGPVWHLASPPNGKLQHRANWFAAPAMDRAWWQEVDWHVLLFIHNDGQLKYGETRQTHSQDMDANITAFGFRPIRAGRTERFLSVLVPFSQPVTALPLASRIQTTIDKQGVSIADIQGTRISLGTLKNWTVTRQR